MGLLAVAVGILVALLGVMRLGWIAEFLSAPIITGFFAGVAVIIVVHQLSDLFGLPSSSSSTLHRIGSPAPDQRLDARDRRQRVRDHRRLPASRSRSARSTVALVGSTSSSPCYEVDVDRDFTGVGGGSMLAGLFGSFPVDASPPNTAGVASARRRLASPVADQLSRSGSHLEDAGPARL